MHLPAGFSIETAAPTTSIPWTGYAVFQIKSTPSGNDLTVTRTLARAFTLLQPDEYSPMRDFYQKGECCGSAADRAHEFGNRAERELIRPGNAFGTILVQLKWTVRSLHGSRRHRFSHFLSCL